MTIHVINIDSDDPTPDCPACNGSGIDPTPFTYRACAGCAGTGKTQGTDNGTDIDNHLDIPGCRCYSCQKQRRNPDAIATH